MKKEMTKDFIYGIRSVLEAITEAKTINKLLVQQGANGEL